MRTDVKALVEQLEAWAPLVSSGYEVPAAGQTMMNASRALTAQAEEIERLRAALKPFARVADMEEAAGACDSVIVNVARCRDARAALKAAQEVKATEPAEHLKEGR